MEQRQRNKTTSIILLGSMLIALLLLLGTIWNGQRAQRDTEEAVKMVSSMYLDELAGRREQVVQNNLNSRIRDLQVAVELLEDSDLSDVAHLQAYQSRMRRMYNLEKFAFVDTNGLIYTSSGMQDNINEYRFDYRNLQGPEISIFNLDSKEKKVVIALPVNLKLQENQLCVCFMEIDMQEMLSGVSMESDPDDATFCNIYTKDGIALSNTILGGLAEEDNLIEAMKIAVFIDGDSYEQFLEAFSQQKNGEVSFIYNGIQETLSFVPIKNTDWLLTYLVRESVISERISSISDGTLQRGIIQSLLTIGSMALMFGFIIYENRRSSRYQLEKETAEAEVRGKQEELEQRIALQKKLEEQSEALSQALTTAEEANKAKTAFLSNMSHEIRTPMNAIIGLDNIALNDPETPEKTKEYLTKIGASADHLLGLINDILDMSRIESGKMTLRNEEFSFSRFLEAINTMFSAQCEEKGLEYSCNLNSEVDDYYIGDNMKLRQILINILSNAVKFTPNGGTVTLDVTRKAQYDNKTTLEFRIADTGIGISKDFLPHLYDAFSQEDNSNTNKYGSSGLGMAITKSFVDMMNGTIEVESEKGKGTTFTVNVTLGDYQHDAKEDEAEEVQPGEMTVLIVDDDPVACEHAKLVLEKAGVASEVADSGEKAIEMATLRHARREPYNLILVDWKMPGMDGVETTRKIREAIGHESAIIILTAYRWDDVQKEALEAGVDSFLSKPLFASAVMDEFRSARLKKKEEMCAEDEKTNLTGKRILLAEDVAVNAEIMKMVLAQRKMEVELAENGRIAVEKFEASPIGYYDAILMDMRMPEMDGLTATKLIRAMEREDALTIPIIALTANAFDEDVQRSLQAGLNAHLSKPVQPDALYETLECFIHK